jgi:hypothetical protein
LKNITNRSLVHSAILGILVGAACGGNPAQPASPGAAGTEPTNKERASCGNHEPGKCASMDATSASPPASDKPFSTSRTEAVAPGKAVEVNLSFPSASKARATFKASAPVAWNVHSHPAGGMVEHQRGAGTSSEIAFESPNGGVYSFMWKNEGTAPVTLEITVSADPGVAELKR